MLIVEVNAAAAAQSWQCGSIVCGKTHLQVQVGTPYRRRCHTRTHTLCAVCYKSDCFYISESFFFLNIIIVKLKVKNKYPKKSNPILIPIFR